MVPTPIHRPALLIALLLLPIACAANLPAQPPAKPAQIAASSPAAASGTRPPATSAAKSEPKPADPSGKPATVPALNIEAPPINIPVVVYDKKGNLVENLTKDNFLLQVDGHPQTIRDFGPGTDLPLTLGLLVDTSPSQRDVIGDERSASSAFLDDLLNRSTGRDRAFLIQFARQIDLLQDTTPSRPKLQTGLKQLSVANSDGSASVTAVNPTGIGYPPSSGSGSADRPRRPGAALYDALFLASDEIMSKQTGRKVIVILSDGVDSGSIESLSSSIEAAQRANTVVYVIYSKGSRKSAETNRTADRQRGVGFPGGQGGIGFPGGGFPGGGFPGGGQGRQPENFPSQPDGKKILQRMADETGGRLFEVGRRQSYSDIYRQIASELRAQYRLEYIPNKNTASDGYHRIVLSFTKSTPKDLFLQTRDGYFSGN